MIKLTEKIIKQWMQEDGSGILFDKWNPGVFSGYVTWTPERCSLALENNTRNREIHRKRQLFGIKEGLLNDLWDDNVAKINFAKDGTLSDGQHRLTGGVETGVTFRCLVTWGVERTSQLVTDRRGTRTLTDDIHIDGFANASKAAAITRIIYLLNKGVTPKTIINKSGEYAVVDAILYNYFIENSEYITEKERMVEKIYRLTRDLNINRSTINLLGIVFDSVSPDDAECFWEKLSTGITTQDDDPVIMLRKRLSDNAHSKTNKIPKAIEAALIIKAWNLFERGESVKCLKFTSGGANPEAFPEIFNPYKDGE